MTPPALIDAPISVVADDGLTKLVNHPRYQTAAHMLRSNIGLDSNSSPPPGENVAFSPFDAQGARCLLAGNPARF